MLQVSIEYYIGRFVGQVGYENNVRYIPFLSACSFGCFIVHSLPFFATFLVANANAKGGKLG